MYNTLKNVISRGEFDLSKVTNRVNTLWVEGVLTDTQRDEILALARSGAKIENSSNLYEKVIELEERVRALETNRTPTDDTTSETIPEYVAGKWYYNGDKVTFNGKTYECVAPGGAVCTWSPTEYPTYWKEV